MVKYSFTLKIKDTNEEYLYNVNLQKNQEDMPELFFSQQVCEQIRQELQKQSLRRIDDLNLRLIIHTWLQDIKEGYRDSGIALDLPRMSGTDGDNLQESGFQAIPPLICPDLSDIEPQRGALPPLNFS